MLQHEKNSFGSSLSMIIYGCLLMALLGLVSCESIARDMGLVTLTDVQMRSGITGTVNQPAVLDPFKTYYLVMAANESRYFMIQVPSGWCWKVYVTGATRRDQEAGRLTAAISPVDPPWESLPGTTFNSTMILNRDGEQALLAVGNSGPTREAVLCLIQEGAPVNVTLESQISISNSLWGPTLNNSNLNLFDQ